MEGSTLFPHKIKWVIPIGLNSDPSVDFLPSVSIEHGPLAIFDREALGKSFSQPVEVPTLKFCPDLDVVITVYNVALVGGEEDCVI